MDNNIKPQRKGYPSTAQKTRLVQLVEADEELRCGKFSATFTKKVAESKWGAIAHDLNSILGAKKSWSEWRKTWHDMRTKAKKRQAVIRRAVNQTGGGPPPDPMSGQDVLILSTISESSLIGHQDSKESIVVFKDFKPLITPQAATITESALANEPGGSNGQTVPIDFKPLIIPHSATVTESASASKPGGSNGETTATDLEPTQAATVTETTPEIGSKRINVCPVVDGQNTSIGQQGKKRKLMAQKRLDKSLQTATALKDALEMKNSYKKVFYENYISEMRRQTDALLLIANSLAPREISKPH